MNDTYSIECCTDDPSASSRLTLLGKLEPSTTEQLTEELTAKLEAGALNWEVDLKELTMCDSQTMGAFIHLHTLVRKHKGEIGFLVDFDSPVFRVLHLAHLDSVLSIRPA